MNFEEALELQINDFAKIAGEIISAMRDGNIVNKDCTKMDELNGRLARASDAVFALKVCRQRAEGLKK